MGTGVAGSCLHPASSGFLSVHATNSPSTCFVDGVLLAAFTSSKLTALWLPRPASTGSICHTPLSKANSRPFLKGGESFSAEELLQQLPAP